MPQSLTITRPLPDPRRHWRRVLDWLLRRPAPEPGNLIIYFPNVEVQDAFFLAPDEIAVRFAANTAEPLGGGWRDMGYLTDDEVPS